jgi:hypothetical protein
MLTVMYAECRKLTLYGECQCKREWKKSGGY